MKFIKLTHEIAVLLKIISLSAPKHETVHEIQQFMRHIKGIVTQPYKWGRSKFWIFGFCQILKENILKYGKNPKIVVKS